MPDNRQNNGLTLKDAIKVSSPAAFNLMIKPVGALCNLDCNYCYYLNKADLPKGKSSVMDDGMLETAVREYIGANDVPEVTFNWHGGEPLTAGLEFFEKAVALQRKYSAGKTIHNTIQTNGTLVDARWADFFAENNFLAGISIDGPAEIHDRFRRDRGGMPTFDKVMRGIMLLRSHGVDFNTMTTVNSASAGKGRLVYEFLKSVGSGYMQFMPVLEHVKYPASGLVRGSSRPSFIGVDEEGFVRADIAGHRKKDDGSEPAAGKIHSRPYIVPPGTAGAERAPWSIGSAEFGQFLCDIFDYWVRNDVGRYFVNIFDATLANWCGVNPGTCVYAQTCGDNSVIEISGDVYPCDHFVYPDRLVGNITRTGLRELMASDAQFKFGIDKRNTLPRKCMQCKFGFACNGECPKHRFDVTGDGEPGLNALCDGYFMFFAHVAPYMDKMKEFLLNRQAPSNVIQWARQQDLRR